MIPRIRLWPALLIIGIAAILVAVPPFVATRTMVHFLSVVGAPILGTLAILLWWLTFSRIRGFWRWWPVLAFIGYAVFFLGIVYPDDPMKVFLYHAPFVALVWVLCLAVNYRESVSVQGFVALAAVLIGWCLSSLVRIDQTDAELVPEMRWAWTPNVRQLLEQELASRSNEAKPQNLGAVVVEPSDWPEFRGTARNGVSQSKIRTDWSEKPPKELWRRRVGAGWGSFAVVGDRCFTQEQRGNDECVVCYHTATGTDLWIARVPGRFFEGIAGEGPRATPTIHEGMCYAFTAFGKVVCLDAATGQQIWMRDVVVDVEAKVPQWGYASSPLVIDGKVLVYASKKDKSVVAYRIANGDLAWANGQGEHGYSSPHKWIRGGKDYVLMVSDYGLEAFHPGSGESRGDFNWNHKGQNRVAQPAIISDTAILLGTAVGEGQGAKRLTVSGDDKLTFTEAWASKSPKPYFNDGVVFENHYYGWDDRNFICLDLKNGKVKWNAGSIYGFGQVVLLPEQKMLLVQAESGKVVLVPATPEEHGEDAKLDALKDKTWNHPVICRGKLFVRNGVEAACYDLSP